MVARRAEGEARRKEAAARGRLYHTQAALHRAQLELDVSAMFTTERHLPTPGERGHSPQRHTVACRPHHLCVPVSGVFSLSVCPVCV